MPPVCAFLPAETLLEVLNEVGVTQDLEEATHLFESFSSMRLEVVGTLLAACTRIKTVRLFLQFAQQTNAVDAAALRERFNLKLGSNTRWTRRLRDGTRITIK
ncbi:type IV toxin-antitoxin system AbiEi family antitoxin domain-containing protein [Massilia sp. B-10]|nr:type IV toxin-antitoxin system AbiEi family antitoxin domain-containing protein [Massilia sp. B-10]